MSQNSQNPFSAWADMSKSMFDAWSTWASTAASKMEEPKTADITNPFAAYYDFFMKNLASNPMFTGMPGMNGGENMLDQFYRQWQESMRSMSAFIPNKFIKDGFDRFLNSYQMYGGLQSFWDSALRQMPADLKDWDAFTKYIMQNYQNISDGLVSYFMPDQIKSFFTMPFENIPAIQQALTSFFKPWVDDTTSLQTSLIKAMQGDKEAYAEFLRQWAEMYKNSFAKLLQMPAVGLNHAYIEKMMKLLDYYVNFVVTFNEFSARISNMMAEAMQKLLIHLAELQAEGKPPETFMEFYTLWSKFNEQAFMDLYAADDFSKLMNETVSSGSKLQILCDDFMQDMLSFLPLPNRRELDDVEREVYELRKQVKAQAKEIKALKEAIAAKK